MFQNKTTGNIWLQFNYLNRWNYIDNADLILQVEKSGFHDTTTDFFTRYDFQNHNSIGLVMSVLSKLIESFCH